MPGARPTYARPAVVADLEEALGIMSSSETLAAPLDLKSAGDERSAIGGLPPVASLLSAAVLALVCSRVVTTVF